jgi:error-prone DNA polymerase
MVMGASTDVCISGWDSALERQDDGMKPAVRLGLSPLKGTRDGAAERIETSRAVRQFESVGDLARLA